MSVAVCRGPTMPAFEAPCWLKPAEPYKPAAVVDQRPPARVDIWNAIQAADVDAKKQQQAPKPYVHPLVRRSSSLMSQKSLEVCTESLGNETGSGDFTDMAGLFDSPLPAAAEAESFWERECVEAEEEEEVDECERKTTGLAAVNYHCSAAVTRSSPRRAFPPPLPSMSRRDGPCLQMRPRREDGRLVVEAVAVRPRGYLHARRQNGRLCLSFVECSAREQSPRTTESKVLTIAAAAEAPFFPAVEPKNEQDEEVEMENEDVEEMEDEEEEEVEVVDRGTVVEVKVSTQPQTPAAGKVHRSRLVINKFVGSTPLSVVDQPRRCHAADNSEASSDEEEQAPSPRSTLRRVPSSTTTLAAAVAVASTGTDESAPEDDDGECDVSASAAAEPKQLLLFTSRRGDKQDLLTSVRRCRQLRQKPLFILEPYCIATS